MTKIPDESLRFLVIIKNDSRRLYERIKFRESEYLQILSLKRTREHFKDIFKTIYETVTIDDLKLCSEDVIVALDNFYGKVEELKWYLNHTEDMPAQLEDRMTTYQREISSLYEMLILYINAEIGIEEKPNLDLQEDEFTFPIVDSDFQIEEQVFDSIDSNEPTE